MAAAAIPLLVSLAPSIISLIVGLVHKHAPAAQAANPQPGTGPVRFADVLSNVAQALQSAANAGKIDQASIPPNNTLSTLIETVVQSMKQPGGVLAAPDPNAGSTGVAPTQTTDGVNGQLVLRSGQRLTITVA
jgi:hypothetical protein